MNRTISITLAAVLVVVAMVAVPPLQRASPRTRERTGGKRPGEAEGNESIKPGERSSQPPSASRTPKSRAFSEPTSASESRTRGPNESKAAVVAALSFDATDRRQNANPRTTRGRLEGPRTSPEAVLTGNIDARDSNRARSRGDRRRNENRERQAATPGTTVNGRSVPKRCPEHVRSMSAVAIEPAMKWASAVTATCSGPETAEPGSRRGPFCRSIPGTRWSNGRWSRPRLEPPRAVDQALCDVGDGNVIAGDFDVMVEIAATTARYPRAKRDPRSAHPRGRTTRT